MSYMMQIILLVTLAVYSPLALGHQIMRIPAPLRYTFNPNMDATTPRDNYTEPITADQFPCKGYLVDMFNDPTGIGAPSANFQAGKPAHIILTGDSTSGSAQISLSGNNGSLTVIHSYEGNVGTSDQQQLDFVIPSDAPTGPVVISFSFFPVGSQEVFVSCAAIRVDAAETNATKPSIPFKARPDIFVSDMNNSCVRAIAQEIMFPDPGPDFTMNHTITPGKVSVDGVCRPVNGFGNGVKGNASGVNFPTAAVPGFGFITPSPSSGSSRNGSTASSTITQPARTTLFSSVRTSTVLIVPISTVTEVATTVVKTVTVTGSVPTATIQDKRRSVAGRVQW